MRNTLICTVGTSLFASNLAKLSDGFYPQISNWKEIKDAFDQKNFTKIAEELIKVDPKERICGAEINTIEEARNKKWISLDQLYLLVSDTDDGVNTGKVLSHYFELREDINFKKVIAVPIESLQDKYPKKFKLQGLRNLVKEIGKIIQKETKEKVAIDATGGYKAQIAIAVTLGQALDIPVYYKHEKFYEIIDFPPLPISLDFDLLGQYADLFSMFSKGECLKKSEIGELDDKLRVFVDSIEEGDDELYELNAIGEIYYTAFNLRHPFIPELKELDDLERKEPTFGDDHHYPNDFKNFVTKIWNENKWIKTCWTVPYNNQKGIKGISFFVKEEIGQKKLLGTFRSNYGARFQIELANQSLDSLNWAAVKLNEKYTYL
ncbi:MAG TPA: putative CRISPR-associated protein [Ignavibacteria bacterium]|nr:putative CRISPR-associated protein [Ignavibacteria bacterium]